MTQRLILAAIAAVALTGPAAAQGGPPGFPPYEVMTIVRSTGLEPLSRPVRRGPNYVLHAVDGGDREVRVVVDARSGRILSVAPMATASRMPPPLPHAGVTMGPYEEVDAPPPGYLPPGMADDDGGAIMDDDPRIPRPPGAVPGAPARGAAYPPPSPRGGDVRRSDLPPPSGSPGSRVVTASPPPPGEPHVITATQPDQNGLLPPPPERFPQRATSPATKPKPPVKRAAAAPPKVAPLPKPRPQVDATPPAPPPAAGPAEPESHPADAVPN